MLGNKVQHIAADLNVVDILRNRGRIQSLATDCEDVDLDCILTSIIF